MWICAGLCVAGAVITLMTVRRGGANTKPQ
jgi:hypothetical protein